MSLSHDTSVPIPQSFVGTEGGPPERGELHETHTAYVIAVGDTVYKMKKPVRTTFLDFSSRAARWEACVREVALNSRFAPDVYRGVAEVTDPDGGLGEPLVLMRRLPSSSRLSVLAEHGRDLSDVVECVAAIMAAAHRKGPFGETIDADGTRIALNTRWHNNIDGIDDAIVPPSLIDTVESRVRRYLAGRAALFDHRLKKNRIVDGHGDLLTDDIFCLPDGPRILDCLDFDDALRHLDGIDDIACLAMDLIIRHRQDLADRLVRSYREAAQDDAPSSLLHHYIAYRAFMRAKVACIADRQGDPLGSDSAKAHAELALEHLRAGAVGFVVVGGLPGTGKSTVAEGLARVIDAVVISSDVVRKELAGIDPHTRCPSPVGEGLYSASSTAHTYAEMFRRARQSLAEGVSVVLDASFTDTVQRERATMISECTHSHIVHLECRVPTDVALDRLGRRRAGPSDADAQVYAAMADRVNRRVDSTSVVAPTVLDTTRPPDRSVSDAYQCWLLASDATEPSSRDRRVHG